MPDDPKQELVVAIAGPAVNVVIAAVMYAVVLVLGNVNLPERFAQLEPFYLGTGSFLFNLMVVNIWLVIFNLIPAFPQESAVVLRGLLATRMDYVRATNIAASVGQFVAFAFGFIGLFYNPFLVFIALFVYMGPSQEAGMVQMKAALGGIPVQRAMLTQFNTLSPHDPLQRAIDLTLAGSTAIFRWSINGGRRIIDARGSGAALRNPPPTIRSNGMKTEFEQCDSGDMLEGVFMRVREDGAHTVPVVRRGELVGLLTMENVGEMLRIHAALGKQRGRDRFTRLST